MDRTNFKIRALFFEEESKRGRGEEHDQIQQLQLQHKKKGGNKHKLSLFDTAVQPKRKKRKEKSGQPDK